MKDDKIIEELVKLSTKVEVICSDVKELKTFHKDTIRYLSQLSSKIEQIERWKNDFQKYAEDLNNVIEEIDKRLDEIEKWKAVLNSKRVAEEAENKVKKFFKYEVKVSVIAAMVSAVVYKLMGAWL